MTTKEGDDEEDEMKFRAAETNMERFIANQVNESLETINEMCYLLEKSIGGGDSLGFTLEKERAPNRSIKCKNCDNDKIEKFVISTREGNLTCTCGWHTFF